MMAKAKKLPPPKAAKKQGKYDITVKLDMTFEDAIKKALSTPIKKKSNRK